MPEALHNTESFFSFGFPRGLCWTATQFTHCYALVPPMHLLTSFGIVKGCHKAVIVGLMVTGLCQASSMYSVGTLG